MSKKARFMNRIVTTVLLILCVSSSFNTTSFARAKETDVQDVPIYQGIVVDALLTSNTTNSGNWTWAETQPWCNIDSGVYIIEDMIINDTAGTPRGSGIFINNSHDVDFKIENCTVTNINIIGTGPYGAGIDVWNSSRGVIYNNTIDQTSSFGCGIQLQGYNCYNITIEQNIVKNVGRHAILMYGGDDIHVINNTVTTVMFNGIYFYNGVTNSSIANNEVNDTNNNSMPGQDGGIKLLDGNENNEIFNNTVDDGCWRGIYMRDSSNNSIYNNLIQNNRNAGIVLSSTSNDNNVTDNEVTNNIGDYDQENGIWLSNSHDNNISGNHVTKNQNGIFLQSSNNNDISGNYFNDNLQRGVYISADSGVNNVTENTVNDNDVIGIFLSSSSDHCIIKDNSINRNGLGIGLYQNSLNNVTENILTDNEYCIFELDCTDNLIDNNTCTENTAQLPIHINGQATGVGANNWTWAVSQEWCSGSGTEVDPYVIENLNMNGFGFPDLLGIYIEYSNVHFVIQNCSIKNYFDGIELEYVNNSQIIDNHISNSYYDGIYMSGYCNLNIIDGNTFEGHEESGIYMSDYCDNNTLRDNEFVNNEYGIYLEYDCVNNTIANNNIYSNGGYGIYIYSDCMNNTITNNFINGSNNGIYQDYCDSNILTGNILEYNEVGIYIYECDYTTVTENVLYNNTDLGVSIDDGSHNILYSNFFVYNEEHAEDFGTENSWNSTTIGNYWEGLTSPDANSDGIVDYPYNITGPGAGTDFLPIAEDGAPQIIIHSPEQKDRIGDIAPSFDVEVTDLYVWEMWYTLDGGLTNYTFTENGYFDQTAWDAAPYGKFTIRFYARDIAGKISFEEVTVRKYSPILQRRIILFSLIAVIGILGTGSYFLIKFYKIKLEE